MNIKERVKRVIMEETLKYNEQTFESSGQAIKYLEDFTDNILKAIGTCETCERYDTNCKYDEIAVLDYCSKYKRSTDE